MKRATKIVLLSLVMVMSLSACSAEGPRYLRRDIPVPLLSDQSNGPDERINITNEKKAAEKKTEKSEPNTTAGVPLNGRKIADRKKVNPDTVGWLYIPGTTINDPILYTATSRNTYYLRRNFKKQLSKDGSFFADYRSTFGEGTREGLARNTVLYGHSWDDNPNSGLFSQIKKYRDFDFAKTHPYIFFSTEHENMAFEVFAVFNTHVNFPYVLSEPNQGYSVKTLVQAMMSSSIYRYDDITVSTSDKMLTLSTCTYTIEGKPYQPEDTNYRFVVLGRLVPKDEALKETAKITKNNSPDHPDTYSKIRPSK